MQKIPEANKEPGTIIEPIPSKPGGGWIPTLRLQLRSGVGDPLSFRNISHQIERYLFFTVLFGENII